MKTAWVDKPKIRIARVDKETNVVVNLEMADQEWINENKNDTQFWFFSCDEEPVFVGSIYDKQTGTFINQEIPTSLGSIVISSDEDFLNVDDPDADVFLPPVPEASPTTP